MTIAIRNANSALRYFAGIQLTITQQKKKNDNDKCSVATQFAESNVTELLQQRYSATTASKREKNEA